MELIKAVGAAGRSGGGGDGGIGRVAGGAGAIQRGGDIARGEQGNAGGGGGTGHPGCGEHNVTLLPIDSEHSAIFQCQLAGRSLNEIRRLVITVSGGRFRTWSGDRVSGATVEERLNHPTWDMGPKVTVDSASLMNKGLEVMERIGYSTCRRRRLMSLFIRNQLCIVSSSSWMGRCWRMGPPDMRLPIQYARCGRTVSMDAHG